jgi:hypothetical protein
MTDPEEERTPHFETNSDAPNRAATYSIGPLNLIWGVRAIAKEIDRTPRQTFYLLEKGHLPANKLGGRWCASRSGLRQFFETLTTGDLS